MRKTLFLFTLFLSVFMFSQAVDSKVTELTKKLVLAEAKSYGKLINIRYDSLLVKRETERQAIMSYTDGSLLKSKEMKERYDDYRASIIGRPSQDEFDKMERLLKMGSSIIDRQKVLILEKYDKADDKKKNIIHTKAVYYLKLDDDFTDGTYQSDYYFDLQGRLIPDIYEYFLEHIN